MLNLLIFLLCVLIMIGYYIVKNYDSFGGIIIILLGLAVIYVKTLAGHLNLFFVKETFLISGVVVMSFTLLCTLFLYFFKEHNKKVFTKHGVVLLLLYIFFGFLQQLLFQFIFLETVYSLIDNVFLVVLISAAFYAIFHWKLKQIRFLIVTFLAGLFWSGFYVMYGNLFWLAISHGILGTVTFLWFFDGDILRHAIKNIKLNL